jgi:hypothetical protein
MITREHKTYSQLIISMLDKLSNINFLQLARCGKHKIQRYRQQFEKQFDFLTFNKELVLPSWYASVISARKDTLTSISLLELTLNAKGLSCQMAIRLKHPLQQTQKVKI